MPERHNTTSITIEWNADISNDSISPANNNRLETSTNNVRIFLLIKRNNRREHDTAMLFGYVQPDAYTVCHNIYTDYEACTTQRMWECWDVEQHAAMSICSIWTNHFFVSFYFTARLGFPSVFRAILGQNGIEALFNIDVRARVHACSILCMGREGTGRYSVKWQSKCHWEDIKSNWYGRPCFETQAPKHMLYTSQLTTIRSHAQASNNPLNRTFYFSFLHFTTITMRFVFFSHKLRLIGLWHGSSGCQSTITNWLIVGGERVVKWSWEV